MCAFHVRPWCAPNIEESRGGRPRVTPDAVGMGSGRVGDGGVDPRRRPHDPDVERTMTSIGDSRQRMPQPGAMAEERPGPMQGDVSWAA